jgi:uncharacterized protein YukE
MEISIRPHELAAAAARLAGCARDLDAAVGELQRRAPTDVVQLGLRAIAASEHGLQLTERAVRTLAEDLDQLATGIRTVAAAYPTIDASAVPRP